ncbi:MAG: hypothetical protein JXB03_12900, partial [Spirochaetales bacterium]|nr:hypothetical protein [Spirochaetales bacterium]
MGRRYSGKRYSLASLVARQPAAFAKHPRYRELEAHFRSSGLLPRIRISSRCFRILNSASVPPENLKAFYRTYRLPADPFFPLFLTIKTRILSDKARRAKEKKAWIQRAMTGLPDHVLSCLKVLKTAEEELNRGRHPLWDEVFIPKTKKRARELCAADMPQWARVYAGFGRDLSARYGAKAGSITGLADLAYLAVLQIPFVPGKRPSADTVNAHYRRLSKTCHPD